MSPEIIATIKQVVIDNINHTDFGDIAKRALALISNSRIIDANDEINMPQSSKHYASIYLDRMKRMHNNDKKLYGLQDTIENLNSRDVQVNLFYLQLENGLISIFLDSLSKDICGLIIFEVPVGTELI